ncbi:MAG: hypothetical protein H6Q89_1428 [Myxococcaceae bacterium]|nr:hypothetical protein [Myxococcaceae bacterium]
MTTALCLLLLCAAPEGEKPTGPPASDMAILYFLAGDLRRAVDVARAGLKTDAVKCKPLFPMLVEYEFLLPKRETLTVEEAKAFLEWDRKISPKAQGKLTGVVYRKYVETPLHYARTANQGGELEKAKKLLGEVLIVDPKNEDALALKALIARPDGGR